MLEFLCAPSVMCLDLGRLEAEMQALEAAGADELHFDIMDGSFVPNITLGFDFLRVARRCTRLPCSAHLMIERPERYIQRFADAGASSITVHVEAVTHAHRVLTQIRDAGASPGIAVNPATPLISLEYLLPLVDRVLLMTVDPGYAGQTIIHSSFERVKLLRENIRFHKYKTIIEVDGNISAENAARLHHFGAESFVLGTASICKGPGTDYAKNLREFKEAAKAQRHLV